MNVEDLRHELGLGLGEVEPFLGKFIAIRLVVVAELAESEVDLLEGILRRVLEDGLLDLFKLTE